MNDVSQRNYIFSKTLIDYFIHLGVRYACVSPGSRNTPIMLALSDQKKIECTSVVDERDSGFIALGLSKSSCLPPLVITTSGTAAANLYPAIIEAFMTKTPLIILTADRPSHMIGTGENQTIDQHKMFGNYVQYFSDTGDCNLLDEKKIRDIAINSYKCSMGLTDRGKLSFSKGPVHLNIPFEKPLHLSKEIRNKDYSLQLDIKAESEQVFNLNNDFSLLKEFKRPIFISTDYHHNPSDLVELSEKYNIPILADCRSSIRYNRISKSIITSYDYILDSIQEDPDLIVRFGPKPISNCLNNLLNNNKSSTYLVDSSEIFNDDCPNIIKNDEEHFINQFSESISVFDKSWLSQFSFREDIVKSTILNEFQAERNHEGFYIHCILNQLSKDDNIIMGNSLPIRNLDRFTFNLDNKINTYTNRGASGIDGLIATSMGVSIQNNNKNALIIGDVSFYHNLGALQHIDHDIMNLNIFILNNSGGHIFDQLDGLSSEKEYKKLWLTPSNLSIKYIANAFNCDYYYIDKEGIGDKIQSAVHKKGVKLIEISIDSKQSMEFEEKLNRQIDITLNRN